VRDSLSCISKISLDSFRISTSNKGWTDDYLCLQWFEKVFLPSAKKHRSPDHPDSPIFLIVDGHGSHVTSELIDLAVRHGVEIFRLPPHTTHRLQPLDVGVFGPLQRQWQKRCALKVISTRQGMARQDVVREYMAARQESFIDKPDTIIRAFNTCGIRPTRNPFTAEDYAPSTSTSILARVPLGFPTESPTKEDIKLLVDSGLVERFVVEDPLQYRGAVDDSDNNEDSDCSEDYDMQSEVAYDSDGAFRNTSASLINSQRAIDDEDGARAPQDLEKTSGKDIDIEAMYESLRKWFNLELILAHRDLDVPVSRAVPPVPPDPPCPVEAVPLRYTLHGRLAPRSRPAAPVVHFTNSDVGGFRARIAELEAENAIIRQQRDRSEAHNKLMFHHLEETQHLLHAKNTPKQRGPTFDDPSVTNGEGQQRVQAWKAKKDKEASAKASRASKRDDAKDKRDTARAALSNLELFQVRLHQRL
jgi:hypothetical protein